MLDFILNPHYSIVLVLFIIALIHVEIKIHQIKRADKMQVSTQMTLRLINNFLINNSENTKKLVIAQLQILSGKSLNEVKNHFMFKSLKNSAIDTLRSAINKRRVKLYNEWYDKKNTFGLDNLTGLQKYIDSDNNIIQLRKSFNTLILN